MSWWLSLSAGSYICAVKLLPFCIMVQPNGNLLRLDSYAVTFISLTRTTCDRALSIKTCSPTVIR